VAGQIDAGERDPIEAEAAVDGEVGERFITGADDRVAYEARGQRPSALLAGDLVLIVTGDKESAGQETGSSRAVGLACEWALSGGRAGSA
jgi:hypothetical protein